MVCLQRSDRSRPQHAQLFVGHLSDPIPFGLSYGLFGLMVLAQQLKQLIVTILFGCGILLQNVAPKIIAPELPIDWVNRLSFQCAYCGHCQP